MTPTTLALFALTEILVCLSPGPAVLLVISQGIRRGSRASLSGAFGILVGNIVYFILSAIGLGALVAASTGLFNVVKWAGAAYLVFLGVRSFLSSEGLQNQGPQDMQDPQRSRLFAQGLITQLANPKAILYFTALLPQFIDATRPMGAQYVVLGVTSILIELPVLAMYGWFAGRSTRWVQRAGYVRWMDRLAPTAAWVLKP
jgi:homoserine/homoserine lactone efflux protein